jgi:multiple sugar transport system substrate-binding protein
MRFLKRFRAATAVMAVLGVVLATGACGGDDESSDGPVTLRYSWWGNADRAALMQQAIDLFTSKNPDIKVTPSFQEFEAYWQKMATETAGGNAPDVFMTDFAYLSEYAGRKALYDLGRMGSDLKVDDLLPGLENAGVIGGKRYAVPVGANTWGYIYNPALFAQAGVPEPKAGWTWNDYRNAMKTITEKTGVHGGGAYTGTYYNLELQLRQEGGQLYTEDGKLGFDKARLAKFFNEGKALHDAKVVLPVEKGVQIKPKHALEMDLIAGDLTSDNPQQLGQYLKPAMLLSASAKTKHAKAAAKLISFMVNDAEAGKIFGANRGLPASNAQRAAVKLEGPLALVAAYEEGLKSTLAKTPPAPPKGAGALEQEFVRINEEMLYNRITVDQAVNQFFTEAAETIGN